MMSVIPGVCYFVTPLRARSLVCMCCVLFTYQGNFREANFQKAVDKLNDGGQPETKGRKGGSKGNLFPNPFL